MAAWSGMSAAARAGVLAAGAAVVAVAGWFAIARGPEPVAVPLAAVEPVMEPAATAEAAKPAVAAEPVAPVAAPVLPGFDVVRVEPDGSATVAGFAAAGAKVSLRVDGAEVAAVQADAQGKFVSLFTLAASAAPRLLSLVATGADGAEVIGPETVALAPIVAPEVAAHEGAVAEVAVAEVLQAPAALLLAPQGVKVLQTGGDVPAEMTAHVAVDSITYAPDGAVMLGGRGQADAPLRLYLNDAAIADVVVGADGAWGTVLTDVAPGIYTLRVDQLDAGGKVVSRFETPFKRETLEALAAVSQEAAPALADAVAAEAVAAPEPAEVAMDVVAAEGVAAEGAAEMAVEPATEAASPVATDAVAALQTAPAAPEPAAAAAIAPELVAADAPVADAAVATAAIAAPVTVTVQPGYTLWGIAQQNFGAGVMYVQVFEANKAKIKDPDLIYPGQVFTIPKAAPASE